MRSPRKRPRIERFGDDSLGFIRISPPADKATRMTRDEAYIIDLCDLLLQRNALRQHRFDFLRGDTGRKLPVDAYYPDLNLVIEYRERQHFEAVDFWDGKQTASGIPRGQQRARYDQRRRDELPRHGIRLVKLCCTDFQYNSGKRLKRVRNDDIAVLRRKLAQWVT